ncbi:hypothetical protein HYPDE_23798 [Hyphomicrobium denitrificans 1NES1]|uniref:Uncharacterized protein n=1 Tax=Hyphomicrobium denitrificans 1NES1 TaxID=670307 RepID=N0B8S3_9HYPH|nr:hypothetical protein [Hyphomicrobium denitrificans]AGK56445.1 hypothetical protein HYPDE_23798 [Hyphomicrobium denitrificans 1NES1]
MFSIYEITAAPHFPHALLPLITATVKHGAVVSVQVSPAGGAADVEIIERGGEICVAISASLSES